MTLLNAFFDQALLLLLCILVMIPGLSKRDPAYEVLRNGYFVTFLLFLWLGVMTYVRWTMDWPLLGIYHSLFMTNNSGLLNIKILLPLIMVSLHMYRLVDITMSKGYRTFWWAWYALVVVLTSVQLVQRLWT